MQAQSASLRVTATRAFRLPELDDQKAVVGSKVIKPGDTVTVDRFLAGELVSSGKAEPASAGASTPPPPFRSNRNTKE